jgi:hypothetical protein
MVDFRPSRGDDGHRPGLQGTSDHRGIVLYTGTEVVPFGRTLHALPVDALWRWGTRTPV